MLKYVVVAGTLAVMQTSAPSFAVTPKAKMATCKFGADEQKLDGAERDAFIKKCMANKNDPRGPAASTEPAQPKN
jgi:hypothetical protein